MDTNRATCGAILMQPRPNPESTTHGPVARRLRHPGRARRVAGLATLVLAVGWLARPIAVNAVEPARAVDFNFQVRPILSDKCFKCHGPDARNRKAGLRLDTKDGTFGPTGSGARAVVPGDLEASELYWRITAQDEAERMPPRALGRTLSPPEGDVLKRWIEQGRAWQARRGFPAPRPPRRPRRSRTHRGRGIRSTVSSWPGSRPSIDPPPPRRAGSG